MTPENIQALDEAMDDAGVRHTTERYAGAQHGYTMSDTAAYNEAATERHFATHAIPRRTGPAYVSGRTCLITGRSALLGAEGRAVPTSHSPRRAPCFAGNPGPSPQPGRGRRVPRRTKRGLGLHLGDYGRGLLFADVPCS